MERAGEIAKALREARAQPVDKAGMLAAMMGDSAHAGADEVGSAG